MILRTCSIGLTGSVLGCSNFCSTKFSEKIMQYKIIDFVRIAPSLIFLLAADDFLEK